MKNTTQHSIHGSRCALGPPVQAAAVHRSPDGVQERAEAGVEASFPFAALAPFIPAAVNAISKLF